MARSFIVCLAQDFNAPNNPQQDPYIAWLKQHLDNGFPCIGGFYERTMKKDADPDYGMAHSTGSFIFNNRIGVHRQEPVASKWHCVPPLLVLFTICLPMLPDHIMIIIGYAVDSSGHVTGFYHNDYWKRTVSLITSKFSTRQDCEQDTHPEQPYAYCLFVFVSHFFEIHISCDRGVGFP